jgi:DNA-binding MarR family transcriptional regulator
MKETRGLAAWVQMIRSFSTLQSLVEDSLKDYDLTLAQFNLLVSLRFRQDRNQNDLARHLGVTKGNVVGLLNRLSRRGLVERIPVEGDLRVNRPCLTGAGRKLIDETLPGQLDLVVKMMQPLGLDELDQLQGFLKRLEESSAQDSTRVASMPGIAIRKAI